MKKFIEETISFKITVVDGKTNSKGVIDCRNGHEIGDLAIKTEAQVLKAAFRETDLVGRLSGDEFCVIAPGFPERKVHERSS